MQLDQNDGRRVEQLLASPYIQRPTSTCPSHCFLARHRELHTTVVVPFVLRRWVSVSSKRAGDSAASAGARHRLSYWRACGDAAPCANRSYRKGENGLEGLPRSHADDAVIAKDHLPARFLIGPPERCGGHTRPIWQFGGG